MIFDKHAASIPNTRRHLLFQQDVTECLETAEIPFEAIVEEDYDDQCSYVKYMTDADHVDYVAAAIELMSKKLDPKEVGKKLKAQLADRK